MRFRKIPIVVEASVFRGADEPLPFAQRHVCRHDGTRWYVVTQQGEQVSIHEGDWIILENPDDPSDYRAYPCDPDVFARTYVPVEDAR